MKKHLLLFILTPVFILSQNLGINTSSPNAKVDIFSNGNTSQTKAIIVNNNTGLTLFSITDNGNISFNKTLQTNNNAGNIDYVLTSNGDNKSPEWVNIKETSLGRWVVVAYNASQNTSTLSSFSANNNVRINMHNVMLNSSSIGVWDTNNREYTVSKPGIYDVTVNIKISADINNTSRNSSLFLQIGNYKQATKGRKVFNDSKAIHLSTKATRYLSAGEKIYAYINSNFDGKFIDATININYSEKIQ